MDHYPIRQHGISQQWGKARPLTGLLQLFEHRRDGQPAGRWPARGRAAPRMVYLCQPEELNSPTVPPKKY